MVEEVLCYNRGCGKTFVPPLGGEEDLPDDCVFHPGAPFFHDAYKGWTCCNRKSTDFTEFLNFKGCTQGKHSRVKPAEPESITGNLGPVEEPVSNPAVKAIPAALARPLPRPRLDAPKLRVKAQVAKALTAQLEKNPLSEVPTTSLADTDGRISVGEPCKNGGCAQSYSNDCTKDDADCVHHPGVPIFHEGMKYWSCCRRRTSDFQSFLNQVGCTTAKHRWRKETNGSAKDVTCRYDWHQTGSGVTVAIYCKRYDPNSSFVAVNPIRLTVHIFFPEMGGSFDLDLELTGITVSEETKVTMYGTKLEVQLRKKEAGSWPKLGEEIPKALPDDSSNEKLEEKNEDVIDTVDLDDLELTGQKLTLSSEARGENSK